ncbi:TPA: transposase [bacterium]|nr:transposase [bacterium]
MVVRYCEAFKPNQKAKIERWFRTLKDHWLAKINYHDFKTLEEYQVNLDEYVRHYNQS